ncbi:hypothetical protein [Rhodococcus aetherivorans]
MSKSQRTKTVLTWLALGIGTAGAIVACIGLAIAGRIQLGDLGTWVGGLASAAAALVALATLRQLLEAQRKESEERRDRAARRAARVELKRSQIRHEDSTVHIFELENKSGHPIYEVKWLGPVAVKQDAERLTDFGPDTKEYDRAILENGVSLSAQYTSDIPESERASWIVLPRIEFTDDDGYRFWYGQRNGKLSRRWRHVD